MEEGAQESEEGVGQHRGRRVLLVQAPHGQAAHGLQEEAGGWMWREWRGEGQMGAGRGGCLLEPSVAMGTPWQMLTDID